MLLKLGTVFSGIGSIEHTLERLGIEYKTVFACDNGGVDIFSKKINTDLTSVINEIKLLQNRVSDIVHHDFNDDNALSLKEHMQHINVLLEKIKDDSRLLGQEIYKNKKLRIILENILKERYAGIHRLLPIELKDFSENLINEIDECYYIYLLKDIKDGKENEKYIEALLHIKISDFKEIYLDISKLTNYKRLSKNLNEIIDTINMLHQRISSVEILKEISNIASYRDKKRYVDELYKGKEKSNFVMQSYKANYQINENDFHWNASFLDGTQYKNEIDLFVGGSPCQSFSLVGKRRGLKDTRGTLFYEYARLIEEVQPKVFIYENVKGLLGHDGGNTWETMKEVFNELNYTWQHEILNAKKHGIPQNRERLFVVGFRKDLVMRKDFEFPTAMPLGKKMKDFLLDNVSGKYYLNKKGVDFVTKEKNIDKRYTQIDGEIQLCQKANQQFNWHGDFVFVEENKNKQKTMAHLEKYFLSEKVEKYVLSSGTKNFYSKPEINLDVARPLLTTMHKMHRAGVDNYVTTEGRIRKLTPRECLRLMGFCDSFNIVVSDTQMYQQAGNSIVVDVLIALVKSLRESLPQIFIGCNYESDYFNNFLCEEQLSVSIK